MTARPTLGRYYADVPNRLVGYLIDLLILSILAVIVAIVVSLLFGPIVDIDLSTDPRVSVDEWLALLSGVLATAVGAVYFVGSWKRSGGTPGQRWLRMGLGTEADGATISVRQGVVRWALLVLPISLEASITPVVSGTLDTLVVLALVVWYLYLLVSTARHPKKQGLHDRVAHTVVTKVGQVVPWPAPTDQEPDAVVR